MPLLVSVSIRPDPAHSGTALPPCEFGQCSNAKFWLAAFLKPPILMSFDLSRPSFREAPGANVARPVLPRLEPDVRFKESFVENITLSVATTDVRAGH